MAEDAGNTAPADYDANRAEFVKELRNADPILRGRFDDSDILDLGLGIATRTPAFDAAFADRKNNPGVWQDVAGKMASEIGNRLQRQRLGKDARAGGAVTDAEFSQMNRGQQLQHFHKLGIRI